MIDVRANVKSVFEILCVILTGAVYFLFQSVQLPGIVFIIVSFVCWGAYIGFRIIKQKSVNRQWGIQLDNAKQAFILACYFFIPAAAGLCVYRAAAAVFWTAFFLKVPNIFPLGLCHGWLGAIVYYLILEHDPFFDIFVR
jgi:hypothetical protein